MVLVFGKYDQYYKIKSQKTTNNSKIFLAVAFLIFGVWSRNLAENDRMNLYSRKIFFVFILEDEKYSCIKDGEIQ